MSQTTTRGALLRQQQRDAAADAARRAGDDGDLAGDDACHGCPRRFDCGRMASSE